MKLFNNELYQVIPLKYSETDIRYSSPRKVMAVNSLPLNWESIKSSFKILEETVPVIKKEDPKPVVTPVVEPAKVSPIKKTKK